METVEAIEAAAIEAIFAKQKSSQIRFFRDSEKESNFEARETKNKGV